MHMMGDFVVSDTDLRKLDKIDATAYHIKNAKYLDEHGNLTQWAQTLPDETLYSISLIAEDDTLSHAIFLYLSSKAEKGQTS